MMGIPPAIIAHVDFLTSDIGGGGIGALISCGKDDCGLSGLKHFSGITTLTREGILVTWFQAQRDVNCASRVTGSSIIPLGPPLPLPRWKRSYQWHSPAAYGLYRGKTIIIHLTHVSPIICGPYQ
jgi:hypothetical protein